jgi:hypothetical protein
MSSSVILGVTLPGGTSVPYLVLIFLGCVVAMFVLFGQAAWTGWRDRRKWTR